MARRRQLVPWPQLALIFGLGGAFCTYLLLMLTQGMILLFGNGRLVQGSEGLIALLAAWLLLSGLLMMPLTWSLRFPVLQSAMIALIWLGIYLLLWMLGRLMSGMPLPIYLLFWAIFGFIMGYALGERPASGAMGIVAAPRPTRDVVRSTGFGRIPQETVLLLSQHTRAVMGPICSVLPVQMPEALRAFTVRAVLDHILRDWWENGNATGLTTQDIDDLQSMVAMAAAIAIQPGFDPGYHNQQSQAIYRAILGALLDDWLHFWNTDGVDGPPRR